MSGSGKSGQKVSRKLKYKELIEKGARIGETLENQHVLESFKNILELIDVCENVSTDYAREGKIEHTSDYLMDAQIIKMSHDLLGSTTEKMSENNFHEDEYVAALLDLMTSHNDNLGKISTECCHTAIVQLSMLGTFSFEASAPKEPKVKRERQTKSKLGARKAPENVTQIVKVDKGAEKIVALKNEIQRICKERKKTHIPYYELVIDPNNYMNSIDAAFQLSFLIRDGIVGLIKRDMEPHVFLKPKSSLSQTQNEQSSNITVQTIMSMDPPLWKKKIKKYKIKEPLLRLNSDEDKNEEEEYSDSD